MKKLLCVLLISIFVCSMGCRDLETEIKFDIKNDYIELKGYRNYGDDQEEPYLKYIGQDLNELSYLIGIKSMDNLPADDYVCKLNKNKYRTLINIISCSLSIFIIIALLFCMLWDHFFSIYINYNIFCILLWVWGLIFLLFRGIYCIILRIKNHT